jgi:hypothetical protein
MSCAGPIWRWRPVTLRAGVNGSRVQTPAVPTVIAGQRRHITSLVSGLKIV